MGSLLRQHLTRGEWERSSVALWAWATVLLSCRTCPAGPHSCNRVVLHLQHFRIESGRSQG